MSGAVSILKVVILGAVILYDRAQSWGARVEEWPRGLKPAARYCCRIAHGHLASVYVWTSFNDPTKPVPALVGMVALVLSVYNYIAANTQYACIAAMWGHFTPVSDVGGSLIHIEVKLALAA